MFKSVLLRCGRLLNELIFDGSVKIDKEMVDMIIAECSKVQHIDIGYREFESKREINLIKPIFRKMKYFSFSIEKTDIDEEYLRRLLSLNKNLEAFAMIPNKKMSVSVLDSLPCETIEELDLDRFRSTSLNTTFQVSEYFVDLNIYLSCHKFILKSVTLYYQSRKKINRVKFYVSEVKI